MWPFKSKYEKLKREDVVDAICELEKQENDIEEEIAQNAKDMQDLKNKGKVEKNRELRLLYAKKINDKKEQNEQNVKRVMYLLYNVKMLNRLKQSIDDNTFFANTGKVSLGNLLADQKGLAQFLNKALNTKVKSENILTAADDTWQEVQSSYIENDQIYGVNNSDDELLAMFETESQLDDEMNNFDSDNDIDLSAELSELEE